jgi:hypothetical protein
MSEIRVYVISDGALAKKEYVLLSDYNVLESENASLKQRIADLEKSQIVWHTDMVNDLPKDVNYKWVKHKWYSKAFYQKGNSTTPDYWANENGSIYNNEDVIAWCELPKYEVTK